MPGVKIINKNRLKKNTTKNRQKYRKPKNSVRQWGRKGLVKEMWKYLQEVSDNKNEYKIIFSNPTVDLKKKKKKNTTK